MLYDDVTGVLMQCISRIPLSYRRKAKTRIGGVLVIFKLSLFVAAEWRSSAKHERII
jgi:hypothetical protein